MTVILLIQKKLPDFYSLCNAEMNKGKVLIIIGVFVLSVAGFLLFRPYPEVMDGDSILPDIIGTVSNFTTKEYALLFLAMGLFLTGLFFVIGVTCRLVRKEKKIE